MSADLCRITQLELSVAHDERRSAEDGAQTHALACDECTAFRKDLERLDILLAVGETCQAPDLAAAVMERATRRGGPWWSVAAAGLIGLTIGAVVGGAGGLGTVEAAELDALFHAASPRVTALAADLTIVERGWQADVPERVYTGTIEYAAPETLAIELIDTTGYPSSEWIPNDVSVRMADGDVVTRAMTRCPVSALPGCQLAPASTAIVDQRPFVEGVLRPLELVGPGRSLSLWSGVEVLGSPEIAGRSTIQIETTVAGVDLIEALTAHGGWRELHATDRVLLWLDQDTMVPVRIEVFASNSPERSLWELRHGYRDQSRVPIFIVELEELAFESEAIEVEVPEGSASGGFVDTADVTVAQPDVEGFRAHRSGHWSLPDGGQVDVGSWSDGRSWLMVEQTTRWNRQSLFGFNTPFVDRVDLGDGSIGYVSPSGDALGIHGADLDVVVSGSIDTAHLIRVARSLGIHGLEVPDAWEQASTVPVEDLPAGTLIPGAAGWSMSAVSNPDGVTIQLIGAGRRSVVITQTAGTRLDPPTGPDFSEVTVRGRAGRYDADGGILEWVEQGQIVTLQGTAVSLDELRALANDMSPQ